MTTGLGYLPTTFDWSQIAYNSSPLVVPFWAQANVFAGWFCIYAVAAPILYYTGVWYTSYLPLTGSDAYDNTANIYNSSRILNDKGEFDEAKYKSYSPLYLPVTFSLSYGLGFAVLSCLITHVVLNHSEDILKTFKGSNKKDIHARLMSHYPDVQWWWYGAMTVSKILPFIPLKTAPHTCPVDRHRCIHSRSIRVAYRGSVLGNLPDVCLGSCLRDSCGHGLCSGQPE
jgi:OPT oligopeptide transporter protein.